MSYKKTNNESKPTNRNPPLGPTMQSCIVEVKPMGQDVVVVMLQVLRNFFIEKIVATSRCCIIKSL